MRNFENEKAINHAVIILVFVLAAVFLIWRAPYGYCFDDEPFIVSLALRLTKGDMLLSSEWHGTQNVAVILLPFLKLFQLFHKDTTGLLLWLRYCYCILWYICCGIVFFVVKNQNRLSAVLVYVYLILFSPMDYMTLSYTSLSLMSCLLICSLLYYEIEIKRINPEIFSVLFAFLSCVFVLSCIFAAIAYIVGDIVFAVIAIIKRNTERVKYYRRHFILINIFVIVAATIYVYLLILRGVDIKIILKSIPLILGDPQHQIVNPLYVPIRDYLNFYRILGKSFPLVFTATLLLCIFVKPARKFRLYIFLICVVVYAYVQLYFAQLDFVTGYPKNWHVAGIALLGLIAYVMLENKPKTVFRIFWGIGLIYSYFNALGSNTGFIATCMTLSVCGVGSIFFIICLVNELRHQYAGKKPQLAASVIVILFAFIAHFSYQLFTRFTRTYFEDVNLFQLSYVIDAGAAKGLHTSKKYYNTYTEENNALTDLLRLAETGKNIKDSNFVSLEFSPVVYLNANLNLGTYSTWTYPLDINRLNDYYDLRPDKIPDLVFCRGDEQLQQVAELRGFDNYTVLTSGQYSLAMKSDDASSIF